MSTYLMLTGRVIVVWFDVADMVPLSQNDLSMLLYPRGLCSTKRYCIQESRSCIGGGSRFSRDVEDQMMK